MISILVLQLLAGEGFHATSTTDGVTVYRRDVKGAIALGAEGRMDASVAAVLAVLLDYDHQPAWVDRLAESRVLARGTGFVDVYQRLHLPIVADRDFTLHVTWQRDGELTIVRFATANDRGPAPIKDIVRVDVNRGSWRLSASGGGTWTVYELTFDPAGALPAWMGRGRAGDEIVGLFETIRKEARRR